MFSARRILVYVAVGLVLAVAAVGCASGAAPTQGSPTPTKVSGSPTPLPTSTVAAIPGSGLIKGPYEGEAKQLTGAGATFPAPLYTKWFSEYEKLTGVKVNYQSIGSGGGIKSITDRTVDFGASDAPMTDEQLKAAKGEILHVPTALGAVVPTYNLQGLPKPIKFTPETLCGIFMGKIKKWSDPALKADNPELNLPDKDIIVVHRSDGSGTTYIWTDYLSTVCPEWKEKVGKGTSVNWPVGIGAKGNEGVSGEVRQNPNSIGYVELIYALQNKLPVGWVKNKAGKFIEPTLESVTAAAAGVAARIPPDLRVSIVDAEGENSYPVSGFTYLLVYKEQTDKAKAVALTRMMWWAIHDAQQYNAGLGYAPLPAEIIKLAEAKVESITVDGQKAFPGK